MANTLWDATGSFGLRSAESMVRKALREYERCRNAHNDDDRRDAALNCAMTLWHLCDWAWAGIAAIGRHSPELAHLLGVSGRKIQKDDLAAWAIRSCPELEICQAICNGTKHVRADRDIRTDMKFSDIPGAAARLVIDNGGTDRDVLPILLEAVLFWGRQSTNEGAMR